MRKVSLVTLPKTWVLAFLLGIAGISAMAQSTTGTISGTVRDSTGAVVPGASITLTNPANHESHTLRTSGEGLFVAPQLPPGEYDLTVDKAGFRKLLRKRVVLSPQDRVSVGDLVLQVGDAAETITVTSDAGQLQLKSESGDRSENVTGQQILNLALNGRNVNDFAKLVPGVTLQGSNQVSNTSGIGSYVINGARSTMKELAIDGATVTRTDNQVQQVTINPDAVGEIKILTSNYDAEYGKAGGGYVSFTTKGGTKDFHASVRYFRRHDSMNANSFFNNENGRPRNLYRYNYYGYDVGGPVWFGDKLRGFNRNKDKLFFFWSQEYYKQLTPENARTIEVPTSAERNGDFSQSVDGNGKAIVVRDARNCLGLGAGVQFPGNVVPKNCWFPTGQAILNLFPAPNSTVGGNQYNYASQKSSSYPRREDIVRIDWLANSWTRVTGRFINNYDLQQLSYGTTTLSDNFPISPVNRPNAGQNLALTMTNTISPVLINEFILGLGRLHISIAASDDKFTRGATGIATPLLFPGAIDAKTGVIPSITLGGLTNQTAPNVSVNGSPYDQHLPTYNISDNLTKVSGPHTLKGGFFLYQATNASTNQTPAQSNIDFTSQLGTNASFPLDSGDPFANALTGVYNSYTQTSVNLHAAFIFHTWEFYAQDTWKVNKRLTLSYGLRFSYLQPLHDKNRQEGLFVPSTFDGGKASRLYAPVLAGGQRRAVDPNNALGALTVANTLPSNYIGLVVPNSGSLTNGIQYTKDGHQTYNQGLKLGPRFGFAYDPSGSGKMVVRGGFGITYDRNRADQFGAAITAPPVTQTPQLLFGDLRDISTGGGVNGVANLVGQAPQNKTPSVISYSLGVQRNIGFGTVVDVSYVGTLGRHLQQNRNINAIPYGATFTRAAQDPTLFAGGVIPAVEPNLPPAYAAAGLQFSGLYALPLNFLRPFAGWGDIPYNEYVGTFNYNSLQVQVNRKLSSSFLFGLAYTFSRNFTTIGTDGGAANPFNTRAYDYKLAPNDVTHNLAINYIYDVPSGSNLLHRGDWLTRGALDGWQISGITIFQSGGPTQLTASIAGVNTGQRLSGSYSLNPSLYLRANPSQAAGTDGVHVNPNAFYLGTPGEIAPWPNTYLRNPGIRNFDISIFKNFRASGDSRRNLQLRLEMFNAFNHPQFSGYNLTTNLTTAANATGTAVLSAADFSSLAITNNLRPQGSARPLGTFFGEYSSARDPRIVQIAVKLSF